MQKNCVFMHSCVLLRYHTLDVVWYVVFFCDIIGSIFGFTKGFGNMAKTIKIKGKMRVYMLLLVVLGVLLGALNVPIYFLSVKAGIAVSIFVILYFIGLLLFWVYIRANLLEELVSFATEYGQVQKQILKELRLPHALLDEGGKILWSNSAFESLTGVSSGFHRSITSVFADITLDKFPKEDVGSGEE